MHSVTHSVGHVDRVVVHPYGIALVGVGGTDRAEVDGLAAQVDVPTITFFCSLTVHRDAPGVRAVALVGRAEEHP